jgi:hypothetical protein
MKLPEFLLCIALLLPRAARGDSSPELARPDWTKPGRPVFVPPPAAPPTTTATLLARDKRSPYLVSAGGQSCITPCALQLPAGVVRFDVLGPPGTTSPFVALVELPEGQATVKVQHLTLARLIAGSLLAPIGAAGLVAGTVLLYSSPPMNQAGLYLGAGAAASVGGGGLLAAGITLLVTSHRRRVCVSGTGGGIRW